VDITPSSQPSPTLMHDALRPIRYVHQELRHVREPVNERAFFLPLDGETPDPLIEPLGHVEIAIRTDRKAGRRLELAIDHHARLELAARCCFGDIAGKDASGAGSADVKRLAVQQEVHGLRQLLPGDARYE